MPVRFIDHSQEILRKLAENKDRALKAVGIEAAGGVVETMNSKYGKPIKDTGTLMGSIASEVSGDSVAVGTNVEYARYVHDGTHKMAGRPFLRDGVMDNKDRIEAVLVQELTRGL